MAIEILHKIAKDNNGNIVSINNAEVGKKYFCPDCKGELIFKNGKIRQKHFSYKNQSQGCGSGGEGYLHLTFKKMLLQYIVKHINGKTVLDINWICNICQNKHNGNLLSGISDAKDEYMLNNCRPDIALINEIGDVPIIIEIIDKHEPEENVKEFCVKNNTILIKIKLDSINDLENIENKIKTPTELIFFSKMNCPVYIEYNKHIQRQMMANLMPSFNNRATQRRPKIDIDQLERVHERKKQQYAIKRYYRGKSQKK
jgi:predicted RNA-binding Zn-ribbon protein involved in translation (DUF1610 family)